MYSIRLTEKQAMILGHNLQEGDEVEVDLNIVSEDQGIGPYEYWGSSYVDSNIVTYIEDVSWWDKEAKKNIPITLTHSQEKEILNWAKEP